MTTPQGYQRQSVVAPRISGAPLKLFVSALESGLTSDTVLAKLVRDSGIEHFRSASAGHASPIQVPLPLDASAPAKQHEKTEVAAGAAALPEVALGMRFETIARFAEAYREGTTDPVQVVRKLDGHITRLENAPDLLALFIARTQSQAVAAAEASAERLRKGQALSVLDGVPVVVKDELDVQGLPTTLGTKFMRTPAAKDSAVVARLKAAGAVIIGKANMHEIGINPVGVNPHHGACRNPYDRARITGGSSSGSAATVAAGLAPLSIGADGGGSIRIPAALCGVVGLKATFGRIPETGVPPLCWNPGHVGPIGLTVADVAIGYALIAGPDDGDAVSWRQSAVHLSGLEDRSLKGLKLGVCRPYFDDADPDVVARCREALKACTDAGAEVVEVPPPDLTVMLWAHAIIILSEMATAMLPHTQEDSSRFGPDARTNLAIGRHFRATDLVHAMRHRHAITRQHLELMKGIDAIVTPTTAITAPAINERSLPDGESNLPMIDGLMRFIRLGNVTGFPGLSVPAGYDGAGLPVGVHFLGRPYQEHLLLKLGRVVEAAVQRRTPRHHVELLR
ncbi:MAG: amidase [Myxococcaceae bacterium]|nr:amidase [Myxococcaceae bacterium]